MDIQQFLTPLDRLIDWLPDFAVPMAWVGSAILASLVLHKLIFRIIFGNLENRFGLKASLVRKSRRPLRLGFALLALVLTVPRVNLPNALKDPLGHAALIMLIVLIGWTALVLINHFADRSARHYRLDVEDNFLARKYVTQLRVLRRTTNIVIVIFTSIAVLLTFESVQEYGVSLFASAGAAGLVLGLAARPVLANLIAGIQIAVTQPIRLDDVVIVENEWGWIEEIFATYVIVRIWDRRRLVVPLSYFIEQPFQNWTRESAAIIGAITWQLDYTAPLDEMRNKAEEFARASDNWDGDVFNLQVTDTDKDTITIRVLVSAVNSPKAWDLRCEIREKMIVWLQETHPEALPRLRGELRAIPGNEPPGDARTSSRARPRREGPTGPEESADAGEGETAGQS